MQKAIWALTIYWNALVGKKFFSSKFLLIWQIATVACLFVISWTNTDKTIRDEMKQGLHVINVINFKNDNSEQVKQPYNQQEHTAAHGSLNRNLISGWELVRSLQPALKLNFRRVADHTSQHNRVKLIYTWWQTLGWEWMVGRRGGCGGIIWVGANGPDV